MWMQNYKVHVHEQAATVRAECPNCGNEADFNLLWNKAGPGIGVPILMFFTEKAVVTTHKQYHLGCPICGYAERIKKDTAQGLICKGAER